MAKSYTVTAEEKCTRCGVNPRSKSHDWCSDCRREKQAEYAEARDALFHRRGFVAGAIAMRGEILKALGEAHPNAALRVCEVISFVGAVKAPEPQSP